MGPLEAQNTIGLLLLPKRGGISGPLILTKSISPSSVVPTDNSIPLASKETDSNFIGDIAVPGGSEGLYLVTQMLL